MADLIFTDTTDDSYVGSLTAIDYKFRVHFRRPLAYSGDFGFDWLQDEFLTCTTLDRLKKEYKPCKILNQEYLVPWMSIKKHYQVRVNLTIEELDGVPSDIDIIKLKPQKGISFEPAQLRVVDIIGKTVKHFPTGDETGIEIKIECTDYIKKDTQVEVYDRNDKVIGKLSLLKNDKEYKLPIRVVLLVRKGHETTDEQAITTHLTTHADSDFKGATDLPDCMHKLENQMNYYAYNQAFVKCEMERGSSGDIVLHKTTIDESVWGNEGKIDATTGEMVNSNELLYDLLDLYRKQVERGQSGTGFFKGVVLIITNFEGGGFTGKGNLYVIDDRNCILFKVDTRVRTNSADGSFYTKVPSGNMKMDVYIHEIGHILSLTHPFHKFDRNELLKDGEQLKQINAYLSNSAIPKVERDTYWLNNKNGIKRMNRSCYLYARNKYTFKGNGTEEHPEEGSTRCMYMDYTDDRKVFTQWQWRIIQESVQRYFSSK